jgi:hypothetical protein
MRMYFSLLTLLTVALLPTPASALSLPQIVGLFHIVTGLLLVCTLGIFAVGFGMYIARLNTWPSYRDTAIKVLIWAVTMLFILILFVALVQFIQRHTALAFSIIGVVAILAVIILIAKMAKGGGEGGEAKKPGGAKH